MMHHAGYDNVPDEGVVQKLVVAETPSVPGEEFVVIHSTAVIGVSSDW